MPCFNEGENVRETITQLTLQEYPEFEIIAVNDGSSDNTG
ncbi:glycosyl transferase, family 2, partial [hydrothermal vent metagenome]